MGVGSKNSVIKYYLYTLFTQMRLTRIVNILYLVQVVGISIFEFTLLQTIFSISQFLMEVPSGILGDYFKKKTITTLGIILLIISQILLCLNFLFHSNLLFYILCLAFIIEGVGRALISGADDALFFEKIREEGLTNIYDKIRGKCQLIASIALGIATFLGTVLYEFNLKLPYIGQALFLLCAIPIILSIHENKIINSPNSDTAEESPLKNIALGISVMKDSPQILFMVFFVTITFGIVNTVFSIMPDYMTHIGFRSSENGMVFMILSLIGGIVATQSYRLSNYSYGKLVFLTSSFMAGSILLIHFHNKPCTFVGLILLYIIIDIIDPIAMKSFNLWVNDNARATFLSLVSFLTSAMTMILYPVAGIIVQTYGMIPLLSIIACGTITMIVISYFIFKLYENKKKAK